MDAGKGLNEGGGPGNCANSCVCSDCEDDEEVLVSSGVARFALQKGYCG